MSDFSVSDAEQLMLLVLQSMDEAKRLPPGTEREFKVKGGTRVAVNDADGNWWWKDEPDKLARAARKRRAAAAAAKEPKPEKPEEIPGATPLGGKKGQAYAGVRTRRAKVKSASDCTSKEFFIQQTRGGKCVSGVEMVRDIETMIEGVAKHEDARSWYRDSKQAMEATFGNDTTRMLALIAATSQRMELDRNIALAYDIYRASLEGTYPDSLGDDAKGVLGFKPGVKPIAGIRGNVERALKGQFKLAGPKIGEFAQALYGDEMARVIDVHMYNLFFGRPKKTPKLDPKTGEPVKDPKTGKVEMEKVDYPDEYKHLAQRKVTEIAERLGWTPAETQAALWVFWLKDVQPAVEGAEVEKKKKRLAKSKRKDYTTYQEVFDDIKDQTANLGKLLQKTREDWAKTMQSLEMPYQEDTLWSVFSTLVEQSKGKDVAKRKPKTPAQVQILDSLIAILQHQSKAYGNASKLVKEIERMHNSGEMAKLIASAGARKK